MVGIEAPARSRPPSPLEELLRTYLETVGGVWDEVEPQVYDVLVPGEGGGGVQRITFDPEALPEHPGAQLASFGTPFIDLLLADAVRRGRRGPFYMVGLNLTPHDLAGRVRRALTLAPPLELLVERVRALHFAQVVFWFQAEFVSDQKEQEILAVDARITALRPGSPPSPSSCWTISGSWRLRLPCRFRKPGGCAWRQPTRPRVNKDAAEPRRAGGHA